MLEIDEIKTLLNNRKVKSLNENFISSVLLPIIELDGKNHILFEVRSKDMDTQPGEICFPGGGVEDGESYKEAAIRETMEELNIKRNNIEVLGEFDYLISETGLRINSFIGRLKDIDPKRIIPNRDEVDHIFTVPIDFLMDQKPEKYYLMNKTVHSEGFPYDRIPNGENYKFITGKRPIYFYEYGDYVIWGFTAWILTSFLKLLGKENI